MDLLNSETAVPWGDETVCLDFPGGPYAFNGLSETQAHDLRGRFGVYCIQDELHHCSMPIEVTRGRDPLQTQAIIASGEYTLDLVHDQSRMAVQGLWFSGSADFDPMTRGAISTPINETQKTGAIFENFLRLLVAYRLLDGNGLVLHSAALVISGGAYLFYGISGAGKSTLAEMAARAGYEIMSDDLNAVQFYGQHAQVRKLPFTGTFSESTCKQETYPLRGIFKLEKASFNLIRPQSAAVSLAALLACAPYVNASAAMLDQLQNRLLQLVNYAQPAVLSFSNTSDFNEIANLLDPVNA